MNIARLLVTLLTFFSCLLAQARAQDFEAYTPSNDMDRLSYDFEFESLQAENIVELDRDSQEMYRGDFVYDPLPAIASGYTNYDMNNDGIVEINQLEFIDDVWAINQDPYSPNFDQNSKVVLILVEKRLLGNPPCTSRFCTILPDLMPSLINYRNDLLMQGLLPRLVSADVYKGSVHQDGRTLLAMRRFVKDVKSEFAKLQGVVMVGSFPEAMLVRSYPWRKHSNGDIKIGTKTFNNSDYIRIWPEIVAQRSDIVLADLDGNWEDVYRQQSTTLPSLMAVATNTASASVDCPKHGSVCEIDSAYEENSEKRKFEDFFHINDGKFWTFPMYYAGQIRQFLYVIDSRNDEVGSADSSSPNPIALPEILVSRINALHIAVEPDSNYTGDYGTPLLDANGDPQLVIESQPQWHLIWKQRNPVLERTLLVEYFARNRDYRWGKKITRHVTAIGNDFDPTSKANSMKAAIYSANTPLVKKDASLLDLVNWLKVPAMVRIIDAHSSETGTAFGSTYDVSQLESAAGGTPYQWSWTSLYPGGAKIFLVPSFARQGGDASLPLFKTIWRNDVLSNQGGTFYMHSGCDANSPLDAVKYAYNAVGQTSQGHANYGDFQNVESLLFYANGLAVVARAKVFNDFPSDFATPIKNGETYGEVIRHYFEKDSQDNKLDAVDKGIRRKKAYFWGLVGDWTLTLN